MFICPLCDSPLTESAKNYACSQGHEFDKAKEGYVNLLPVQFKHSREPGDNEQMTQARRAFLNSDHYQPLRHKLAEILLLNLSLQTDAILDIGCGEGYYTAAFADIAAEFGVKTYGLDVSKVAIRYGAKRYSNVTFCVASSHRLPFADNSLDGIIRIYAPCKEQELQRVVKPGGWIITVVPGAYHLMQLKALIYDEVKLHQPSHEKISGFTLEQDISLKYDMKLNAHEAVALLQMTPFAWRAGPQVWDTLKVASEFDCQTDFCLRLWRRRS